MFPSTNNALERNNGIIKQYYTNRTRHSIPALVGKLGDYLKDQTALNKDEEDFKVNHDDLKLAEAYLDKNKELFVTKSLKPNKKYRTIIKQDSGILTGQVTKITAVPSDEKAYESVEDFKHDAYDIFKRKSDLDYDNFDQFKSDSKSLHFIEWVQITKDTNCFVCSCEVSMKGKECLHTLAILLNEDYLVKPSDFPKVGRWIKKKGNRAKNEMQRRF